MLILVAFLKKIYACISVLEDFYNTELSLTIYYSPLGGNYINLEFDSHASILHNLSIMTGIFMTGITKEVTFHSDIPS